MDFLLNVFEFIATCLYVLFWCFVAGVGCFFVAVILSWIRENIQNQREAELLEDWNRRTALVACAAKDLDHPDQLQRELAEYYISQRVD